jgi:hypothetical protein
MAKDITLGKFTMRPSASFALEVAFNEEEFKLTDPNGEAYTDPRLESFTNNHFTPTIGFDSGGSPLWSGDWGSVKLGVAEEFSFTIIGTGSSSPQNGTHGGLIYDNKISPYATFSFDVAQDLSLGAKLNVPLWFGGAPNAAAYDGYFGVGAKQVTTFTATPPTTAYTRNNENNLPTLGIGFQYVFTSNGLFRDAVDKLNLNEKLRLNWGILVFLPGYLYTSNYEYDDPAGGAITISDTRGHYWFQGDNNFLQILSAGFTFAITPAFIIDAGYNQNQFKVLLNVKY